MQRMLIFSFTFKLSGVFERWKSAIVCDFSWKYSKTGLFASCEIEIECKLSTDQLNARVEYRWRCAMRCGTRPRYIPRWLDSKICMMRHLSDFLIYCNPQKRERAYLAFFNGNFWNQIRTSKRRWDKSIRCRNPGVRRRGHIVNWISTILTTQHELYSVFH